VYLTQSGEQDLTEHKFAADFVVFVNFDGQVAEAHLHDGKLDFKHLTFYVVPCAEANRIYLAAVKRQYAVPITRGLKKGGVRSLRNMDVNAPASEMARFKNAWNLIHSAVITDA
jgi:hypothetical protein